MKYRYKPDGTKMDISPAQKFAYTELRRRVADVVVDFCKRQKGESEKMLAERRQAADAIWTLVLGDTFAHACGWMMEDPNQTLDDLTERFRMIQKQAAQMRSDAESGNIPQPKPPVRH